MNNFFYLLTKREKIIISPLLKKVSKDFAKLTKFITTPIINNYVHLIGFTKRNPILSDQMELRLKYKFPKMYNHINSLYKEKISFINTARNSINQRLKYEILPNY